MCTAQRPRGPRPEPRRTRRTRLDPRLLFARRASRSPLPDAAPPHSQPPPPRSPAPHSAPIPYPALGPESCLVYVQLKSNSRARAGVSPRDRGGNASWGSVCMSTQPVQGHNPGFRSKRLNQGPSWPRVFRQCSHSRLQHLGVVVRGDSVLAGNSTERPLHPACGPGQGHLDTPTSLCPGSRGLCPPQTPLIGAARGSTGSQRRVRPQRTPTLRGARERLGSGRGAAGRPASLGAGPRQTRERSGSWGHGPGP